MTAEFRCIQMLREKFLGRVHKMGSHRASGRISVAGNKGIGDRNMRTERRVENQFAYVPNQQEQLTARLENSARQKLVGCRTGNAKMEGAVRSSEFVNGWLVADRRYALSNHPQLGFRRAPRGQSGRFALNCNSELHKLREALGLSSREPPCSRRRLNETCDTAAAGCAALTDEIPFSAELKECLSQRDT